MATDLTIPNHHAHYPGFRGLGGVIAAITFAFGRDEDAEHAVRLTGIGPGDVLVDVGCGAGVALRRGLRAGATAVGVDPAPVMVRTSRLLGRGARGARYVEGAAEQLPLEDASATVVWSLAAVHHWADIEAGIAEARRVLRPGGRFLALEHKSTAGARGIESHGWTEGQAAAFAERCEAHGFTAVTTGEHPGRRPAISVLAVAP